MNTSAGRDDHDDGFAATSPRDRIVQEAMDVYVCPYLPTSDRQGSTAATGLGHCGDESEHSAHEWERDGRRLHCIGTTREYARRAAPRFGYFGPISPPPIEWGSTMCGRRRCIEIATLSIDGWPFCLLHGDDEFDRAIAIEQGGRDFTALLPGLDE